MRGSLSFAFEAPPSAWKGININSKHPLLPPLLILAEILIRVPVRKNGISKMVDFTESGILTTASDQLFAGGREGNFFALDARNGSPLWHVNLGGSVAIGPMTYSVDGHQYVAVCAGNAMYVSGQPN